MTRTAGLRATFFLPLVVSGCMLLNGRCIYELRGLTATGEATTDIETISGQVTVSEQRDSDPNKSLYWLLLGPMLKQHVLNASFRDAANPGEILLPLTLSPANQESIAEGEVSDRSGINLNGNFEIIAAGRGILVLETDLSSQPFITIPLTVAQKQDWTRPYCS